MRGDGGAILEVREQRGGRAVDKGGCSMRGNVRLARGGGGVA